MKRLGFGPFVRGLDAALEGGVPQGYWVSVFGPPGAYKTLHALAWCMTALAEREKCIYVSTESTAEQLRQQLESLGWEPPSDVRIRVLYASVVEKSGEVKVKGDADLVIADLKTLRYLAVRLNRVIREESESGGRRKLYLWYDDPNLLVYTVMLALSEAGVLNPTGRVSPEAVRYASLMEAAGKRRSQYTPFEMVEGMEARIVIDSMAPFIVGRYSVAGRIMTDVKYRLMAENLTYLVINHVSKTREDELGAEIGHVVDGRIRLWHDVAGDELRYYGLVVKMRATDHSRRVHTVRLATVNNAKTILWEPTGAV